MNFPFYIAKRYLFSRKSHNVINIISGISVAGVAIGTMALIVVLSAFNGLENLVISLFNSFDPDIKITLKEGKTFNTPGFPGTAIKDIEGVVYYTEVLEESALIKYREQQYIATIKGVSADFVKMSGLDSMITEGNLIFQEIDRPYAIVGQGIAYSLSLSINDVFNPLTVYVPRRGKMSVINPENAFISKKIQAGGIFSIQKDFDTQYILVPISFARDLLQFTTEVSAIEIGLDKGADVNLIKSKIKEITGENYEVKDRYEQHTFLYKIMKSEKWAVFLILTFILIIATFNSIASVTMIILDKKKDIGMLWSMGSDTGTIRKIFLAEGLLLSFFGNTGGLLLGVVIWYLQQTFKLIKFEGNFVADAIPVSMEAADFIYVFITVFVIGLIAAWLPSSRISPQVHIH